MEYTIITLSVSVTLINLVGHCLATKENGYGIGMVIIGRLMMKEGHVTTQ